MPIGKYRSGQPTLFQAVSQKELPARLPGSAPHPHDTFGPSHVYVDSVTGWPWDRRGGDWVDANGTRYGSRPWFSAQTDIQGAQPQVKRYSTEVTALVQHCQTRNRWLAMLLNCQAGRTLAGTASTDHAQPTLVVEYNDGTSETLLPWVLAVNSASSQLPSTMERRVSLPCFIEFKRPTKGVRRATLAFTVTEHWSGNNTSVEGYLLDPPVNTEPVLEGIAQRSGQLDAGIVSVPGVIGAHRYTDGSRLDDFMLPVAINHSSEAEFDPAIYGTGPTDLTKLPHLGLGKWILSSEDRANWSLVPSSYAGEGFSPLAPGLGAMRIVMPAQPGITDGSEVRYAGTTGANGMIYLPEAQFGRLGRMFVRYYFRLAGPYQATKISRKQVRNEANGPAVWTTMAGKFGIGIDHSTGWGGVSGTSGGPRGWQMRSGWIDCDAEMGGPDEGGWAVGHHLYDYYQFNPPGYNYGREQPPEAERWGQRGGLGGMLYANHWYCLETELKLNTISNNAPGFIADGELRTWIDGRLTYERTGMVFRTGPILSLAPESGQTRPCRELGARGLWLNWFHGGKTRSTFDRTSFYSGLVWSDSYIGPMKQP